MTNAIHSYRTHKCNELRKSEVGKTARLSGWVHRIRDHGGVLFIDLRDTYGMTQCVVEEGSKLLAEIANWRPESVVTVTGTVKARTPETVNSRMPTGEIELSIEDAELQSPAAVIPFQIAEDDGAGEDIRLRHRYLDLRREKMQRNIRLRNSVIASVRKRMWDVGFQEFQTPNLTASSPEGARDYLVPSRLHPGKFYALPQSPQQFKQLLMVAGFDRYFQVAPCFRDEDGRADRLAEHYQLDVEMSFVTEQEVHDIMTPVIKGLFEEFADWTGTKHKVEWLPKLTYKDAMLKYGSDKPDLRNPLEIVDVTAVFARDDVEFKAFKSVIQKGGVVRAIRAPNVGRQPRSFFDKLNSWAQGEGAPGLGYILFESSSTLSPAGRGQGEGANATLSEGKTSGEGKGSIDIESKGPIGIEGKGPVALEGKGPIGIEAHGSAALEGKGPINIEAHGPAVLEGKGPIHIEGKGPIAKFIPSTPMNELCKISGAQPGDALFFVCNMEAAAAKFAGLARDRICDDMGIREKGVYKFCWVVDFPMYEFDERARKIEFSHNPFSMPQGGLETLEKTDPLQILAHQYDCVCNGFEISSGAIRNHRPDIMEKAFAIAGYSKDVLEHKFAGMLNAFRFGAPPHGGCAFGIDRLVMILAHEPNLREVNAFVMNGQYEDPMMNAPSDPTSQQLKDLHIKLDMPKAQKIDKKIEAA